MEVRPATGSDLPEIAAIQASSPEAAQWNPADYLAHDCLVARLGSIVVAFLVSREIAPGEREILNLAVDPSHRRSGIAKRLLGEETKNRNCIWFLEVRESNRAALDFYKSFGFRESGLRNAYYSDTGETAIVMRFLS